MRLTTVMLLLPLRTEMLLTQKKYCVIISTQVTKFIIRMKKFKMMITKMKLSKITMKIERKVLI